LISRMEANENIEQSKKSVANRAREYFPYIANFGRKLQSSEFVWNPYKIPNFEFAVLFPKSLNKNIVRLVLRWKLLNKTFCAPKFV
jgi:hypothetical protein